jgi:uncharacterized iron-regulated membrane protein
VHLWSGIILGIYILMMSVTGSVLVYSNELYRAATPQPIISTSTAPRLTDSQLSETVMRSYRGYQIARINRARNADQSVDVWLSRAGEIKKRLFDPRTGADLGDTVPRSIWVISKTLELHDDLLAGPSGRKVNGIGAGALLLLAATGLVIWWPGIKSWRRSLVLHRGVGFRRSTWHLHSMFGFWSFGFIVVFGLSGIYLSFPETLQDFADWLQPPTPATAGTRIVDKIVYWLAFLHFGRINGIGIPCRGPGFCDQTTKAVWAFFGLAPAVMLVTGAMMWWSRVLRRWMARNQSSAGDINRSSAALGAGD